MVCNQAIGCGGVGLMGGVIGSSDSRLIKEGAKIIGYLVRSRCSHNTADALSFETRPMHLLSHHKAVINLSA